MMTRMPATWICACASTIAEHKHAHISSSACKDGDKQQPTSVGRVKKKKTDSVWQQKLLPNERQLKLLVICVNKGEVRQMKRGRR